MTKNPILVPQAANFLTNIEGLKLDLDLPSVVAIKNL
jgi:hypothetical protein